MRVEIYRNLTRKCWSIRDKRTRRVTGHADYVELADCLLRVSEAGRQRVLRTRRKDVHAWIEGNLISIVDTGIETDGGGAALTPVTYNPYLHPTFVVRGTNEPITTAPRVVLARGAYAEMNGETV